MIKSDEQLSLDAVADPGGGGGGKGVWAPSFRIVCLNYTIYNSPLIN